MTTIYYDKYYNYNTFFILNDNLFIYIIPSYYKSIYDFELKNNKILQLKIINKKKIYEDIFIKIIYKNKETNINLKNIFFDNVKIGNINLFTYDNDIFLENNFYNFNCDYYITNNKLLNKNYLDNIKYVNNHWLLCGQYNPYLNFKYLLKKYEELIMNLKTENLTNNSENKNTLLFIDDRYDPSFIYLLKLFIYSVDKSWNITIFTTNENKQLFEEDLNKLNVYGKIKLLDKNFTNKNDYSNLLKNIDFWKNIEEENCLLFQYDSFVMNKFKNIFYNYNYIGARWPHNASKYKNIYIGNGGTSFRKCRIMEKCIEYYMKKNKNDKKHIAEDVYFAELLYENNLLNCTNDIADSFSFENIFLENSIYGHQIYNSISLDKLDSFVFKKLKNMFEQ